MSIVYVGLPVQLHSRRFHFDKGRRWNAVEHLVLLALVQAERTAGQLAEESRLPRRVVLEVLIRLMRAGWVELRAGLRDVTFRPTRRGIAVAQDDELPAVTQRMARGMSFAIDLVTGCVFRRRDLQLLRLDDWRKRTDGRRAVVIEKPDHLPQDLGHVAGLLGVLFNEDEQLVRVDTSDHPPSDRLALFSVRDGSVEYFPPRAHSVLKDVVVEAASKVPPRKEGSRSAPSVSVTAPQIRVARQERQTAVRHEDFIRGGKAHEEHIIGVLRKARQQVVIHSTFLNQEKFEILLPAFRVAVEHRCKIDILWGQSRVDGGVVKSLHEAEGIRQMLREAGLDGAIEVHRQSTRSHAKLLIADDGTGGFTATVGSCNWLYSGFESYELSVRLRDPRLVGDVLFEAAELARPSDGQLPELTARLAQRGRELKSRPPISGGATVRILAGEEHDDCVLEARDHAQDQITVLSHRLGVTAKPAIIIPVSGAIRARKSLRAQLFYGQASGPVQQADATAASWTFREQGVELVAVHRPRIHAKALLWDDDVAVVTSLNWLSADPPASQPLQEIGVSVKSTRVAAFLRESFDITRSFGL